MHVSIEEISPVERRVAVRIDWATVAIKLEEEYRRVGREVSLKGYRKGKVPRATLERMFWQRVEQEAKRRLVDESLDEAGEQLGVDVVADPVIEIPGGRLEKGASFLYTARVEVRAPFVPRGYFGIEVERASGRVTEADVDGALAAWQRDRTPLVPLVDRAELRAGDLVVVHVTGTVTGALAGWPTDVTGVINSDDLTVEVGTGGEYPLPGLARALVGAPVAAREHSLSFTIPPNSVEAWRDFAGTQGRVIITVLDARERRVQPLDDGLVRASGEADSVGALREVLRGRLLADAKLQGERNLQVALMQAILDKNPFEVAPSLVESQLNLLLAQRPDAGDRAVREQHRPQAVANVRAFFLIRAIAEVEGIVATPADVEKRLVDTAAAQGKSPAALRAELEASGTFELIESNVIEEKTVALLLSRATITAKPQES